MSWDFNNAFKVRKNYDYRRNWRFFKKRFQTVLLEIPCPKETNEVVFQKLQMYWPALEIKKINGSPSLFYNSSSRSLLNWKRWQFNRSKCTNISTILKRLNSSFLIILFSQELKKSYYKKVTKKWKWIICFIVVERASRSACILRKFSNAKSFNFWINLRVHRIIFLVYR